MKCPVCGYTDERPKCPTCGLPVEADDRYDVHVNADLEHEACRVKRETAVEAA